MSAADKQVATASQKTEHATYTARLDLLGACFITTSEFLALTNPGKCLCTRYSSVSDGKFRCTIEVRCSLSQWSSITKTYVLKKTRY